MEWRVFEEVSHESRVSRLTPMTRGTRDGRVSRSRFRLMIDGWAEGTPMTRERGTDESVDADFD